MNNLIAKRRGIIYVQNIFLATSLRGTECDELNEVNKTYNYGI